MGCAISQDDGPGLTEDEIQTIVTAERVVNSLSIVGSSSIIACWIFFPSLRKFAFTLVFYLSISDVLGGFAALISPGDHSCGALCLFQAYLVSIFGLSSVLWTACIGHCLFRAIRHQDVEVERFKYRYHLFSWGLPLILAFVPQLSDSYGNDNGSCWIRQDHPTLRFIQFYVPLWSVIAYNASIYIQIVANLRPRGPARVLAPRPLPRGPRRLLVLRFRLQNSLYPGHPTFILFLLHRLFAGSQGLLNCVVYGLNGAVRAKVHEALCGGAGGVAMEDEGKMEGTQLEKVPINDEV